jgi:hypothetical protein
MAEHGVDLLADDAPETLRLAERRSRDSPHE